MADTPTLPNLTVQQLEYLVAVAAAPTRAAAAARVGVTPSALTQGLVQSGKLLQDCELNRLLFCKLLWQHSLSMRFTHMPTL